MNNRPFFSIIIPCYNSRETIGNLLTSIKEQNMNDEIEIILSDDNSTDPYQDIVDKFKDSLNIKQIKTDYNFAPGNTREKGVSIATGEWLIFADHDDEFIPDTLPIIKKVIINSGEKYYAIANFYEVDAKSKEVVREMKGYRNWNHAKFYNLDNLWKAYDIHFQKDLLTHEDICISSQVNCALQDANGDNPLYIPIFCYIWISRPTTISRSKYKDNYSFLETFLDDYIKSTGEVYLTWYNNNKINYDYALKSVIEVLLFSYFYMQRFKFERPNNYLKENDDVCRKYLVKIKSTFNVLNDYILNYVSFNDAIMYINIREVACIGCGPFIETETFLQWLDSLHVDIKPKQTMIDLISKE